MKVIGISIYPQGKSSHKLVVNEPQHIWARQNTVHKAFIYLSAGDPSKQELHTEATATSIKTAVLKPIREMLKALNGKKEGSEHRAHQCPKTGEYDLKLERGPLGEGETKHFDNCEQRIKICHKPTGRLVVIHYKANA